MAQCNDCYASPGLNGDALCVTCKGSGKTPVVAEPKAPEVKKVKETKKGKK